MAPRDVIKDYKFLKNLFKLNMIAWLNKAREN